MRLKIDNIKDWKKSTDKSIMWQEGFLWHPYDGSLRASRTKSTIGDAYLYVFQINDEKPNVVLHQFECLEKSTGAKMTNSIRSLNLSCFFDKKYVSLLADEYENSFTKLDLKCRCDADKLMEHIEKSNDFWVNISFYANGNKNNDIRHQGRHIWHFNIAGKPQFSKIKVKYPLPPYPLENEKKLEEWNKI